MICSLLNFSHLQTWSIPCQAFPRRFCVVCPWQVPELELCAMHPAEQCSSWGACSTCSRVTGPSQSLRGSGLAASRCQAAEDMGREAAVKAGWMGVWARKLVSVLSFNSEFEHEIHRRNIGLWKTNSSVHYTLELNCWGGCAAWKTNTPMPVNPPLSSLAPEVPSTFNYCLILRDTQITHYSIHPSLILSFQCQAPNSHVHFQPVAGPHPMCSKSHLTESVLLLLLTRWKCWRQSWQQLGGWALLEWSGLVLSLECQICAGFDFGLPYEVLCWGNCKGEIVIFHCETAIS